MKPTTLIDLLQQLLAETDKMNIGKIYIAIIEEANAITFADTVAGKPNELMYKHLVKLAIKDFIHSGRADHSAKVIEDVISIIKDAEIMRK